MRGHTASQLLAGGLVALSMTMLPSTSPAHLSRLEGRWAYNMARTSSCMCDPAGYSAPPPALAAPAPAPAQQPQQAPPPQAQGQQQQQGAQPGGQQGTQQGPQQSPIHQVSRGSPASWLLCASRLQLKRVMTAFCEGQDAAALQKGQSALILAGAGAPDMCPVGGASAGCVCCCSASKQGCCATTLAQPGGECSRSGRHCDASQPSSFTRARIITEWFIEGLMCCRGMLHSRVRGSSRGRVNSMGTLLPSLVVSRLHRLPSPPHSRSTLRRCRPAGR